MSDVKLVKTLEAKRRGRLPLVWTNVEEDILLPLLKAQPLSKKELVAASGLKASLVQKFLKEHKSVIKIGSKKGTKYSAL